MTGETFFWVLIGACWIFIVVVWVEIFEIRRTNKKLQELLRNKRDA